jgi:hypothetical protein
VLFRSIFDLDKNLALSRADLVLHCYGDSLTDKGKFLAFFKGGDGRDRIKELYINGKKYYSYSDPKANFYSTFGQEFVLDEKEYETKKQIGVDSFLKGTKTSLNNTKDKLARDKYINYIYNKCNLTQEEIANIGNIHRETVLKALKAQNEENNISNEEDD